MKKIILTIIISIIFYISPMANAKPFSHWLNDSSDPGWIRIGPLGLYCTKAPWIFCWNNSNSK